MTFFQLQCFISVAEYKNFTKAANHLHITQPAITKALKSLETELSFRLFIRDTRTVSLTPAGQSFYEDVSKAIQILDEGIKRSRIISSEADHVIRIGTSIPELASLISSAICEYRMHHPDSFVSIQRYPSSKLSSLLISGKIDAALDDRLLFFNEAGLRSYCVTECETVALMSSDNILSDHTNISADDLKGATVILPASGCLFDDQKSPLMRWLAGIDVAEYVYVDTQEMLLSYLLINAGIAFTPKYLFRDCPNLKQISLSMQFTSAIDFVCPACIDNSSAFDFIDYMQTFFPQYR